MNLEASRWPASGSSRLPDFTADSVKKSNQIRLPFGEGKTSPVAAEDVARVVSALLANPQPHIGKIYRDLPPFVVPMQAMLVNSIRPGDWIYEIKFDGYRAVALRSGNKTRILSRSEKDLAVNSRK